MITVDVPIYNTEPHTEPWNLNSQNNATTFHPPHLLESMAASIEPDGLLLYVSEASYESGTSPLSSWIPINGYDKDLGKEKDPEEEEEEERTDMNMDDEKGSSGKGGPGPLDLFQRFVSFFLFLAAFLIIFRTFLLIRLVKRRLERVPFPTSWSGADVDMDH